MSEIERAVLKMPNFIVKESSWETKNGKVIRYRKETCKLNSYDDRYEYHLQITRWPRNTSIDIVIIDTEEEDCYKRCVDSEIFRLSKLPHAKFELQRDELIQKILRLGNEKFGYLTL